MVPYAMFTILDGWSSNQKDDAMPINYQKLMNGLIFYFILYCWCLQFEMGDFLIGGKSTGNELCVFFP